MKIIHIQERQVEKNAIDKTKNILSFGPDNLYPNRVNYLKENSPRTDECFKVRKRFVYGNGFKNTDLSQLIVNSEGETMDIILDKLSNDVTIFGKGYLHVHYNSQFKIEEIYNLPYDCMRKGNPTELFYKGKMLYYPDWEGNIYNNFRNEDAIWLNKFNPIPMWIKQQIKQQKEFEKNNTKDREIDEFIFFNGQYVSTGIESDLSYSPCVFQSAYEDAVTDGAMKLFRLKSVKNNFNATVMMFFDKFKDEIEKKQTIQAIRKMTGEENANSIMAFEKIDGHQKPEIQEFKKESLDGYYNVTFEQVRETIRGSWEIHPALLDSTPGKLGADEEEATAIYNEKIKKERMQIQSTFFKVFKHSIWSDQFQNFETFELEPFNFKSDVVVDESETVTLEEKKENKRLLSNFANTLKSLLK